MQSNSNGDKPEILDELIPEAPTPRDQQVQELQEALAGERDARREERFLFIVVGVLLLDVVFFSVIDNFGGPLALLILQMLILVPLAKRMGMEEIATILDRVLGRLVDNAKSGGD